MFDFVKMHVSNSVNMLENVTAALLAHALQPLSSALSIRCYTGQLLLAVAVV